VAERRAPGKIMAKSQVASSNSVTIDRPLCPKCGSVMWLVRVQAEGQGIDKQTFECPVCDLSKNDSGKSE
jgi:transposase-like protein